MSPEEFIKDVREDDINIMHHCIVENKYEALGMLTAVPYFRQVVNDNGNEAGWTPLLTACANETGKANLDIVKLLVYNGADLLAAKTDDGISAAHLASTNGDLQLLDYILTYEPSELETRKPVHMKDINGSTPSHYAGSVGKFDVLNLLIEHGAKLEEINKFKLSVFDCAVSSDDSDLLTALWPYAKKYKRDMDEVSNLFIPLNFCFLHRLDHLVFYILLQAFHHQEL